MLKKMMNTRQAVKSVEGYNTLSRREQDKIAGESGLLICWIFLFNTAVNSIVFPASRDMV